MTAPTAAMIKAGAEWLRMHDADRATDYGYEQLVTLIWTAMETARGQQRWDDAVARELVGDSSRQPRTPEEMRRATARVRGGR